MTLKIKEYNSSDMLTNSIDFHFESSFDKKTKKRSIDRLLDFLITWYTGKKSIFTNCLFIIYATHNWVIQKDETSSSFIDILSEILNALEWKELSL